MIKYGIIADDKTKAVSVFLVATEENYKELGAEKLDCEQAWNGGWYLVGFAPKKPADVSAQEARAKRNALMDEVLWRVERYNQQKQLGIETTDTEEEFMGILRYIQYLRDVPEQEGFPETNIQTLSEFTD